MIITWICYRIWFQNYIQTPFYSPRPCN